VLYNPQESTLSLPPFEHSKAIQRRTGHKIDSGTAWAAFTLDAAQGLSPTGLAKKYGLTIRKVEVLLRNKEMQAQIAECARRLSKVGDYARNKLIASAPDLVDAQLEVALARDMVLDEHDRPITGDDGRPRTTWRYDTRERMAAGRYCLDKILPTITRVEQEVQQVPSEAVLSIRDSLAALTAKPANGAGILDSPYILEGEKAVPKAIDVGTVRTDGGADT